MKHYGASLAGLSNQIDGGENSVLTVGADDSVIISTSRAEDSTKYGNTAPTGTALSDSEGLIILTENADTHVLSADGSEVSIASIAAGGHTAAFNSMDYVLPMRGRDANGNLEWDNSPVRQIITRTAETDWPAFTATLGGSRQSTTANATITGADLTAFVARFPRYSYQPATFRIGTTTYHGSFSRLSADATTTVVGEFRLPSGQSFNFVIGTTTLIIPRTAGTETVGNVEIRVPDADTAHLLIRNVSNQAATAAGTVLTVQGDASFGNDVVITGDLTVSGDSTVLNTATVVSEDKYLAVNSQVDADGNLTGTPTADGGLLVRKATPTTVQAGGMVTNDNTPANNTGLYAGIRFNENAPAAGATNNGGIWEVSRGVAADGSTDPAWTRILLEGEGGTGSVNKFSDNFSKAAAVTFIHIQQTTHMLNAPNIMDGDESIYSVQVFEAGTGYMQQILPQQIFVCTGTVAAGGLFTGSPAAVSGDVVIQFGATTAALNGFVTIKA